MPPSKTPQRARMRGGAFLGRGFFVFGAAGDFARAFFFGGASTTAATTGAAASGCCPAWSACLRNSRRFRIRPAMTACFLGWGDFSDTRREKAPPSAVTTTDRRALPTAGQGNEVGEGR